MLKGIEVCSRPEALERYKRSLIMFDDYFLKSHILFEELSLLLVANKFQDE
jgi:hypothetical protein